MLFLFYSVVGVGIGIVVVVGVVIMNITNRQDAGKDLLLSLPLLFTLNLNLCYSSQRQALHGAAAKLEFER